MALAAGTRLGAYEIVGLLGAGGMGEVYRAHDSKLDRDVALKIIPHEFARDAERVARFRREAKTLASINHPHIAQVHGLEETNEGLIALVMELVDGEDLAERLKRGPISLDEALPIARQIAEALEAAHEQGIVHRDLKPANIKVRDDGTVKVLDFGLAKAIDPGSGLGGQGSAANSPTITSPAMTMRGVILGTAAYMAPEQAKGKPVDRRADIWAFGCVLYEMLTGARPFDGDDTTEILGSIVKSEPDWNKLPSSTTASLTALLRRCLQKDVRKRQQHIGDARLQIDEVLTAPSESQRGIRRPFAIVPWSIAAAMTVAAVAFAAMSWPPRAAISPEPIRLVELVLPDGVGMTSQLTNLIDVSFDGNQIAFVGTKQGVRHVYVRNSTDGTARALEGTNGAVSCAFAPDGKSIAVVRNTGQITTVSFAGGLATNVIDGVDVLNGVEWLDDNRIVFSRLGALWAVTLGKNTAAALTTLDAGAGEVSHGSPISIPGRQILLFQRITRDGVSFIEVLNLESHERTHLVDDAIIGGYSTSGHLLLIREGRLAAAPFDAVTRRLTGPIVRIPSEVSEAVGMTPPALSQTGTLVSTASERAQGRLLWVSRRGDERTLDVPLRDYLTVRLSADGRRVVYGSATDGAWTLDLVRGTSERIVGGLGRIASFPLWVPGQPLLAFLGGNGVSRIDTTGARQQTRLEGSVVGDLPSDVTPDGRYVGVQRVRGSSADLYLIPLDGSAAKPLVESPAFDSGPSFSPDGRWFAYVSDESGRPQVYIRSMSDSRVKHTISANGGAQPTWRGDGKELFYREGDKMMAVSLSLDGEPRISTPTPLFERRYMFGNSTGIAMYDVSNDGQQFLMVKDEGGRAYLKLVLNFPQLLEQIAPVSR